MTDAFTLQKSCLFKAKSRTGGYLDPTVTQIPQFMTSILPYT